MDPDIFWRHCYWKYRSEQEKDWEYKWCSIKLNAFKWSDGLDCFIGFSSSSFEIGIASVVIWYCLSRKKLVFLIIFHRRVENEVLIKTLRTQNFWNSRFLLQVKISYVHANCFPSILIPQVNLFSWVVLNLTANTLVVLLWTCLALLIFKKQLFGWIKHFFIRPSDPNFSLFHARLLVNFGRNYWASVFFLWKSQQSFAIKINSFIQVAFVILKRRDLVIFLPVLIDKLNVIDWTIP